MKAEPGERYVQVIIFIFLLACLGWGLTIKANRELSEHPTCLVNDAGGISLCGKPEDYQPPAP